MPPNSFCIIFDIDGTLADNGERQVFLRTKPKNWVKYNEGMENDKPIAPTIKTLQLWRSYANADIFLVTGRSEEHREVTKKWLYHNAIFYSNLYMRADKDYRDDTEVKSDIADEIEKTHQIVAVYDDRQKVVDMWRARGILCYQCAPGDF